MATTTMMRTTKIFEVSKSCPMFRVFSSHSTHEVFNQQAPLNGGYNVYSSDRALKENITRYGGDWHTEGLKKHGELIGSDKIMMFGDIANKNIPLLKTHDANGRRIDRVEYHPYYHELMNVAVSSQVTSLAWNQPVGTTGAHVARAGLAYMQNQADAGHCCPITMTYAAVPALRAYQDQSPHLSEWIDKLTSTTYDPSDLRIQDKKGAILGMSMTEKQGGSDVQANTTVAVDQGDGMFALTGHKWFTSAPNCDGFLTLARVNSGKVSCFLIPRRLDNGDRNHGLQFQKLKDKIGDRSNASSEVEYRGALGWMVGEEGQGVKAILNMVHHTRLDCCLGSSGGMRRGLAVAMHHAEGRSAFGQVLSKQPLMMNVLADIGVEVEAATALTMRIASSFDVASGATPTGCAHVDDPAGFSRLATAVAKYFVCKQYPGVAYECMETLGGNGFVEDFPMARIYRQAPLNAIWEGSGNVVALDVLRTLGRVPTAAHSLRQELSAAAGKDIRFDKHCALLSKKFEWLKDATDFEKQAAARWLVEDMARALQGACLLTGEIDKSDITSVFCETRLDSNHGHFFGSLPSSVATPATCANIMDRFTSK